MNRTILCLLLASCCAVSSLSLAQQKEAPPVRLEAIAPGLYAVLDGAGARGGAWIGENEVLVIDTKMDRRSVDQTIAEIGKITNRPVRYLINTHSDGDHVNGNQYFPERVTVIAHENCRKEMLLPGRDGKPSPWARPELARFLPAVTFQERMDLHLGAKNVQLWYFGVGHTTGDAVVYFPDEKVAFLGDQMFATRPQLIHSYKGGNSFEHVKTLAKMLDTLDAQRFATGHEELLDRAAVRGHIGRLVSLQAKVESLVKQGRSLDEAKREFQENESRLVESIYSELKK